MRGRRGKRELTLKNGKLNPPQWIKRRKGKEYIYRGEYAQAVKLWHKDLARIEAEEEAAEQANRPAPPSPVLSALSTIAQGIDGATIPNRERRGLLQFVQEQAAQLPRPVATPAPLPAPSLNLKTLTGGVGLFLQAKRAEAEAGGISAGRWDNLRMGLDRFAEWFAPRRSLAEITGATLTEYWLFLFGEVRGGRFSAAYARELMRIVRQCVNWAWENERVRTLPRNIRSQSLRIPVPAQEVPAFTAPELKTLLEVASARERLYILLGLNCGMYSKDISDLHPSEVDWEAGTITRKRSKTRKCEGAPIVCYRLWPETLALLRQFKSDNPDHVLLNQDGQPLNRSEIRNRVDKKRARSERDGEKLRRTDAIHLSFKRVLKKAPTIRGAFKMLRKSGTTLLEKNPEHARFQYLYLADVPKGIAAKHYAGADQEGFDRALEWLREQITVAKNSET